MIFPSGKMLCRRGARNNKTIKGMTYVNLYRPYSLYRSTNLYILAYTTSIAASYLVLCSLNFYFSVFQDFIHSMQPQLPQSSFSFESCIHSSFLYWQSVNLSLGKDIQMRITSQVRMMQTMVFLIEVGLLKKQDRNNIKAVKLHVGED